MLIETYFLCIFSFL